MTKREQLEKALNDEGIFGYTRMILNLIEKIYGIKL